MKEESPDKGLAPYQIYAQVKKPPKPNRKENDTKTETKQLISGLEKEVSPVTEIKNDSNTKSLEKPGTFPKEIVHYTGTEISISIFSIKNT